MALDPARIALSASAIAPLTMLLAASLLVALTATAGSWRPNSSSVNRVRSGLLPGAGSRSAPIRRRVLPALVGIAAGMMLVPVVGPPAFGLAQVLAVMGWLMPRLREERGRAQERASALGQVQLAMALLRAQIARAWGWRRPCACLPIPR